MRDIGMNDRAVLAAARQRRAEDLRALLRALAVLLSAAALTAPALCVRLRRRRIATRI